VGRVDEVRARYDAELALAELEDELSAAKENGEATPELKRRVREARRAFREARAGDAVASPAVIEVSTDLPTVEG
jgi:hypothetical protein